MEELVFELRNNRFCAPDRGESAAGGKKEVGFQEGAALYLERGGEGSGGRSR